MNLVTLKFLGPVQMDDFGSVQFRKLPFYPLNYRARRYTRFARYDRKPGVSGIKKERLLCALFNDLTAAIVTALRADTVIHHSGAAVRAYAQSGNGSEVMSTTLVSSLLRDFVFRMCHCLYFLMFIYLQKVLSERRTGCSRCQPPRPYAHFDPGTVPCPDCTPLPGEPSGEA